MQRTLLLLIISTVCVACEPTIQGNSDRFKTGVFEVPAVNGMSKSRIIRKDSIQIEKYTKLTEVTTDSGVFVKKEQKIDTFYIQWKNHFFYTARMKSPKTEIDKEPMFYQITKITKNSYDFSMRIGYSEFRQTGTVTKIDE